MNGGEATPAQVVDAWASEAPGYDYKTNSCRAATCGHYTQMVWRNTHEVGCAVAQGGGRQVVVSRVRPARQHSGPAALVTI